MVGHLVGPGVARTQQPRERLAGGIREAEHRVEAPSALVVRARALLGLGVDLDERGIDVEDHRRRSPWWRPNVATPRRALRRTPRPARPSCQVRSRGRPGTRSSPTGSARRGPLGRGGARCRRSSRHHRRASASTGRAPCPDRGAASARRAAGSEKRAHFRVPTGRQRPEERAVQHGPPPGHRRMPQPGRRLLLPCIS